MSFAGLKSELILLEYSNAHRLHQSMSFHCDRPHSIYSRWCMLYILSMISTLNENPETSFKPNGHMSMTGQAYAEKH